MVLTEVEEYSMRSAAVNMAKAISVPRSQTGERIVDSYTTVSTSACSLTCCGRACTANCTYKCPIEGAWEAGLGLIVRESSHG